MVTYYNKKDLVKFGNHVLSDARKERIRYRLQMQWRIEKGINQHVKISDKESDDCRNFVDTHEKDINMIGVSHADISNWLTEIKKD